MAKKKPAKDEQWAEVKRRCRLSAEHVERAKEMGLNPRKLIRNIPSPQEQWKLPVREWIDEMYEKRTGKTVRKADPRACDSRPRRDPGSPPEVDWDFIDELQDTIDGPPDDECIAEFTADPARENAPPDAEEIAEERRLLLEVQRRFALAAEWVARELSALPQVRRVVLFGSVANPLREEIPRFKRFRRWRVALPHECANVDLAVWLDDFSELRAVQKAKTRALNALNESEDCGVASHQVDMFLHNAADGAYAGRLCQFAVCPKGKRECDHPDCGRIPYLTRIGGFVMRADALSPERIRVLFDRDAEKPI